MSPSRRHAWVVTALVLSFVAVPGPGTAQMVAPNPYVAVDYDFGDMPDGRTMGATSAIYADPDGRSIWVGDRCGQNMCDDTTIDPILQFDLEGNLIQSFGAGLVLWPHGLFVDEEGNVWVADAVGYRDAPPGRGHVVLKFSPTGELLMTLGVPGVAGRDEAHLQRPADMVVASDGSIFVADGHHDDGNNRVVKFDAEGNFVTAWGETGSGPGQFLEPHGITIDSQGRVFVADRYNSRIQVFTQDGEWLASWTQFGRPSGVYIDGDDILYASDSESNTARNPGWLRGIYIGSARTGWVDIFVPERQPNPDRSGTSGGEGAAVDAQGNIYVAEVGDRRVVKYVRRSFGGR